MSLQLYFLVGPGLYRRGTVCVSAKYPLLYLICSFPGHACYSIDEKEIILVVVNQKNSEQVSEHRCNVLEILQKYLKGTKQTYMSKF